MLNANEIKMLNGAIDVKRAALKRAANTESDEDIKALRLKQDAEYGNLQNKLNTKGLFDETNVSQQIEKRK